MTKAHDPSGRTRDSDPLVIHVGDDELIIRQRYELLSIVNDLLIGTWFLIGSFLFLSESSTLAGTWLFIIGSTEMLIRPAIRFARGVHLRRFRPNGHLVGPGSHDF
ncbi:YrhK family protein [Aeromicrobium sp. CF3.5]|uniref:YrhK family protein n=1 Tax=Aeromicrobium sp. CF3.5 TaxID=3373078 RepID=UPI003EE76D24